MNLSVGLTHTNDRLDVTDCDRNTAHNVRLTPDVCVELSNLLLVDFVEFGVDVSLCVNYVLLKHFLIDLEVWVSLLDLAFVKKVVGQEFRYL